MPRGLVRSDPNSGGKSYRDGSPVTPPIDFGTDITLPHDFGNDVNWSPSPNHFGNSVTWIPDPAHFGNKIAPPFPAPTFTSATPDHGPAAGGTSVAIVGSGFSATGLEVLIGGQPCTSVVASDDTHLTCDSPAGSIGTTDIEIITDGGSVDVPSAWTYDAAAPALVAHAVSQQASSFTPPSPTSPIDTTGANFIAMAVNAYDNQGAPSLQSRNVLIWDSIGTSPVAAQRCGGTATLTGTSLVLLPNTAFDSSAAANGWVGLTIALNGFSSQPGNNGYWLCTASSTTSITVTIPSGGATDSASAAYLAPSKNVWAKAATPANDFGSPGMWMAVNATVGANHYFAENDITLTGAGDGSSFAVAAFSGVATSSPYLQNTVSGQTSTPTVEAPALTPTAANNLILTMSSGLGITGPETVDSSFIVTDAYSVAASLENPIALAYLVAPNTTAVQPKWTTGAAPNRIYGMNVEFAHQ
jgi:hypothetical protein